MSQEISGLNIMQRDLQVVPQTSEIPIYYIQSPRKDLPPHEKQDTWSSAIRLLKSHSMYTTPEMSTHKSIPSYFFVLQRKSKSDLGIATANLNKEVLLFLHSKCEIRISQLLDIVKFSHSA